MDAINSLNTAQMETTYGRSNYITILVANISESAKEASAQFLVVSGPRFERNCPLLLYRVPLVANMYHLEGCKLCIKLSFRDRKLPFLQLLSQSSEILAKTLMVEWLESTMLSSIEG